MLDFLKEKKLIIGAVIIMIIGGGMYIYNSNNGYVEIDNNVDTVESQEEKEEQNENIVIVHIAGEVKKPGIVKLKEGSRIEDAINEAGGLTDKADISNINLAYILEDGTKIKIPSIYEKEISEAYIVEGIGNEDDKQNKNTKININTANEEELQALDGIGASLATRIIEYREKNGKFKKIEDIKNVAGIGDSKYESIKNNIKV